MSTDFKSAEHKIADIVSKYRDVDPDLRFMALSDLNKLLAEHKLILNKVNHYSDQVTAILLEALNDSNSDVQNQALRCFAPLVEVLEDQEVIKLIEKLGKPQLSKSSITTSIQTMAVGEVLKNINLKYKTTGTHITDILLPSILKEAEVIDSLDAIEILTVLLQNLGNTVTETNLTAIYSKLITTIFKGETIVAKKAIAALGFLAVHLQDSDVTEVLQLITANDARTYEQILLKLLTYISLIKSNYALCAPHLKDFFKVAFDQLYLNQDELDDDQTKIDDVRYESLHMIETLLTSSGSVDGYLEKILTVCKRFLEYDPYANDIGEDEDDFSDPEYSDDEYDEVDDNDDNSWKLRKQSAKIVSTLIKLFPQILPQVYSTGIFQSILSTVSDSSDAVSFEKITTLNTIVESSVKVFAKRSIRKRSSSDVQMTDKDDDPLSILQAHRHDIVIKFINELNKVKNNGATKYNALLDFFQNFSTLFDDLKLLLACVREHNFGINLDLLKFYSAVLKANDLEYFGSEFQYIVELVNSGLISKNQITVENSMATAVDLLNLTYNQTLTDSIIEIVSNAKNDSGVRNGGIQTLGNLTTLPQDKLNEILELFAETLKYEPIVIKTIDSITSLVSSYKQGINAVNVEKITERYSTLVNNTSYVSHVIDSLVEITQFAQIDPSIGDSLLKIFESDNYQSQILRILSHLNFDNSKLQSIFLKAASIDEVDETALLEVSKLIGAALIPILEQNIDANPKNIKILANVVIHENLTSYVSQREAELAQRVNAPFNLRLLGYVGQAMPLTTSIEQLESFFKEDDTKIFAAEAIGMLISNDAERYLPIFLEKIAANRDSCLLLIAIKQVLKINKELSFSNYESIWTTLFDILSKEANVDEALTRIASQDIGLVLVNNHESNFFYQKATELLNNGNKSVIYAVIAAIKFTLAYDNIFTAELVDPLLLQAFACISNEDLDVKQVAVVTLMTALNNHFTILVPHLPLILPFVYGELGTKKQYEESIQIGPFKHKIDRALEVRKNAFEILYKLTLSQALLRNIDFNELLVNVVEFGLKSDIVSISSLIIIKVLAIDDVILSPEARDKLSAGIDKLLNQIKKKEEQQKDTKEEQETKTTLMFLRNEIFQEEYAK